MILFEGLFDELDKMETDIGDLMSDAGDEYPAYSSSCTILALPSMT